jgi:hypothetical protein
VVCSSFEEKFSNEQRFLKKDLVRKITNDFTHGIHLKKKLAIAIAKKEFFLFKTTEGNHHQDGHDDDGNSSSFHL